MPILGLVTGMQLHAPAPVFGGTEPLGCSTLGFVLLCSLCDSVAGPGLISGMLSNTQTLLEMTFISLGLHKHPRDRAGLVCRSPEISDCLIHFKPEKMKVPGFVGIRKSGELEENLCFGKSESASVCGL